MTEIPNTTRAPQPEPEIRERDVMGTIQLTVVQLLERGGPWEILPGSLPRLTRAAEAYLADAARPPDGRQRVREVWLQGAYRPAYLGASAPRGEA